MTLYVMGTVLALLGQRVAFSASSPTGTGLEWMALAALLLPALLLVLLVYVGADDTV